MTAKSNSVKTKVDNNGKTLQERYYDSHGKAYLDIDYVDHGNPKMHPHHMNTIFALKMGHLSEERERRLTNDD